MQTISIISLKGGVAKTTTAINTAYLLATIHNKKVLVIDNDKQGNASKAFNVYDPEDTYNVAKLLLEKNLDIGQVIKPTDYKNIDIISANMDLLDANLRTTIDTSRQQQTRFKKALTAVSDKYDFCIIDNAPDINMSIMNALTMSNYVIVPIIIDQYSFDGLDILKEQMENTREDFNPSLNFLGCLITQYQNNDVNNQGIEYLRNMGFPVFKQSIRKTIAKVNESTFAKMPISKYSSRCGAAQDYKKFVDEFLKLISSSENVPNLGTK
ncbi:MAG: ParA family protein [Aminipila sp.]